MCMKKRVLSLAGLVTVIIVAIATILISRVNDQRAIGEIAIKNVEAIANIETNTTINCVGTSGKCKFRCGMCGTEINSKGRLVGTHTCNQ